MTDTTRTVTTRRVDGGLIDGFSCVLAYLPSFFDNHEPMECIEETFEGDTLVEFRFLTLGKRVSNE